MSQGQGGRETLSKGWVSGTCHPRVMMAVGRPLYVCGRGPKVCPRLSPAVASPFGEHLWLLVLIKVSAELLSVTSLISPRLSRSCYGRHSPGC